MVGRELQKGHKAVEEKKLFRVKKISMSLGLDDRR
jgi:hypothetical protein